MSEPSEHITRAWDQTALEAQVRQKLGTTASHARTMARVTEAVCAITGLTLKDLRSPCRHRRIAWARQFCWLMIRQQRPDISLPAMGRFFHRDHSTIHYGIREARRRLDGGDDG